MATVCLSLFLFLTVIKLTAGVTTLTSRKLR
jgi:hypothetical protein